MKTLSSGKRCRRIQVLSTPAEGFGKRSLAAYSLKHGKFFKGGMQYVTFHQQIHHFSGQVCFKLILFGLCLWKTGNTTEVS